ncbi:MAG: hypothetical protein HKP56_06105 [Anderseniella sp.]|nr:hypothetical protein [Anderseniella sp.]
MQSLFKSGDIIDLILLIMVVEVIALLVWRYLTGTGVAPGALLPFLAAGVCLMLAVKFALTGQDWTHVATALGGAFIFHLADVACRWKSTE